MLFFLKNDTITEILNLKNYFYFPLCGVSLKSNKRRRGKNYFHKSAEGERVLKFTTADTNKAKRIFNYKTCLFLGSLTILQKILTFLFMWDIILKKY